MALTFKKPILKTNRLRNAGGFCVGGDYMKHNVKELEMLKLLSEKKRIELLEEKVQDLENLVEQFREVIKHLQYRY